MTVDQWINSLDYRRYARIPNNLLGHNQTALNEDLRQYTLKKFNICLKFSFVNSVWYTVRYCPHCEES